MFHVGARRRRSNLTLLDDDYEIVETCYAKIQWKIIVTTFEY